VLPPMDLNTESSANGKSIPFSVDPTCSLQDRIAVNGYAIQLPGDISTGDQLFDLVQAKRQLRQDVVAGKRYPASMVDEGEGSVNNSDSNPWRLRSRFANLFTDEEVESYDCHFFRVTDKLARSMDIRQLGILQSVWHALEDAGLPAERLYRTRTGIFAAGYVQVEHAQEAPDETTLRGSLMSSLSDHVAFFLGTHGPSVTLETACSSSLVALSLAVAALRKGDCDYAIVACVNIPQDKDFHLSLQACGVLSTTGTSHPFEDAGPKGYVRAEGYGCIVLRRFRDTIYDGDRVLCTIRNAVAGSAGAVEGLATGAGRMYESPCVWGMKELMARAYEGAGLSPALVSYMECHATGTYVGDVLELEAIGEILGMPRLRKEDEEGHNLLRVASVKSNIGHAEVSAGLFSLAKVIEMMRRRMYLPTAGVTTPRTDFDWEGHNMRVIQTTEPFGPLESTPPVLMGVNSFGIGGSYAHVIVEEYRPPKSSADRILARHAFEGQVLLPLSAVSNAHLKLYAHELLTYFQNTPEVDIRDVCGTMAVNRTAFQYRKALVVGGQDLPGLLLQLKGIVSGPDSQAPEEEKGKRILFAFTGQGAQWMGCGETLMAVPVYREAVLEVDALFQALSGYSILEKAQTLSAETLRETQHAQPVTFLIQVGIVKLLESSGIWPSIVTGHSAGEVASAYAAGLLTLDEAVQVVYHRSQEQQKLAGCGRLLAVGLGQNEVMDFLATLELSPDNAVEIACVNSPSGTVLAGVEVALNQVKAALPPGTFSAFVQGNIAFHSSHVDPILPNIRCRLTFLDRPDRVLARTNISPVFVSTVTGEESTRTDAEYWCRNVRSAVLFQHAVQCIFEDEDTAPDVVLEIGPHKTLAGPVLQTIKAAGREALVLPTLTRNGHCLKVMMDLFAMLFESNVKMNFETLYHALSYSVVDIPKHPFIKTRMHELVHIHNRELVSGLYLKGPVAGSYKSGAYEVEVCDRTFKSMMDHKMGGQEILPGCFYVEMALEATGLPCALTNVEFKSMCKIPRSSSGNPPTLVSISFKDVEGSGGEIQSFLVRSTSAKIAVCERDEPLSYTDHCTGLAIKRGEEYDTRCQMRSGAFGLLAPWKLEDIGEKGLATLKKHHTQCLASSTEHAYGIINKEGLSEYGPSFQVISSLHGNEVDDTFLCVVEFDNVEWNRQGGSFGIQLLDAMYQLLFLLPSHDPQIVVYAGGFEAAHFLRKPSSNKLYVFLDHDSTIPYVGRKKSGGDLLVYDENGVLLLAIKAINIIFGASTDTTKLSELVWQSREQNITVSSLECLTASVQQAEMLIENEKSVLDSQRPDNCLSNNAVNVIDTLALSIAKAAQAFQAAHSGSPTVFRVLEVVEDSSLATFAEALGRLTLDPHQIIEVFIGSHDIQALNMVAGTMSGAERGLRVRKILMPTLDRELADYAFDVVALHAWHTSGKMAWQQSDSNTTSGETQRALNVVTTLESFMTPGSQFWVLGLDGGEKKAWVDVLQPLSPDLRCTTTLVAARMMPRLPTSQRTYVVIAENSQEAALLTKRLTLLAGSACSTIVVTCGANAKAHFQDNAKCWETSLESVLASISVDDGFQGLVFLGGLDDETILGTMAFSRLAKLCQAVMACEQKITALMNDSKQNGQLWIVTEGAYAGKIRPNQGCIQGFTYVIAHELPTLEAYLIDMATDEVTGMTRAQGLEKVAEILAYMAREKCYLISNESVLVPRYFPIDMSARRSRLVLPTDSNVAYCCDVSTGLSTPGQVNVLFQSHDVKQPGPDQVTVDIHAAALNFRDVLIAINMLPELSFEGSYYGRHLGMEAAGLVSAVGTNVTHLKVGDRVATAEASCFGNRLNAPANRVVKLVESISFEVAASTQSVYNTAHHALVTIARIKKGDRVLIHAAAGGVGHAAISVCQHIGAIVYATASAGKRATVQNLGVEYIYDSRSTSWFSNVMRDTNYRGVDAVLNSLAGKHQQLGIQALAPGGRFLEIGKLDIYDNAKLGLLALRKNGLFVAIDMDRLALDDPELTIKTTSEVFSLLSTGAYRPIPTTIFPMDRIRDTIELIKAGKHTGKAVLTNYTAHDNNPVPVEVRMPQRVFHPNATYLITGGAGGFGSKMVRWAFARGARHFVITVTKRPERVAALFSDLIATSGCTLETVIADTASRKDMADVVCKYAQGTSMRPPLKAILHVAGVSLDTVLTDVTADDLLKVGSCKALGAWYLHELTKDLSIETFVVISSVASLMGGRGRAAYSSANAFMDALIRHRRSLGLPGTAFNMTSLSDVGILANDIKVRKMQLRSNVEFVRSARALQDLEDAIVCQLPLACELFFRENAVGVYPNRASFLHGGTAQFTLGADAAKTADRALTSKEVLNLVADTIKSISRHKEVLGCSALFSVGMDSFSTVELISRIKQTFGVEINPSKIGPATTVADVAKMIYSQQSGHKSERKASSENQEGKPTLVSSSSAAHSLVRERQADERPTLKSIKSITSALLSKTTSRSQWRANDVSLFEVELEMQQLDKQQAEVRNEVALARKVSHVPNKDHRQPSTPDNAIAPGRYGSGIEGEGVSVPLGCFGFRQQHVTRPVITEQSAKQWLHTEHPVSLAKARLLCLPWAGGTSRVYDMWEIKDVEIVSVVMPGRDSRKDEKAVRDIYLVAEAVVRALRLAGYLDPGEPPLSLFGHSYGAYVALEVAHLLQLQFDFVVDNLFVASAFPPHRRSPIWWYSCGPLLMVHLILGWYGGLPDDYRKLRSSNNREATKLCSADLSAMDFYHCPPDRLLKCPIHALYGSEDRYVH